MPSISLSIVMINDNESEGNYFSIDELLARARHGTTVDYTFSGIRVGRDANNNLVVFAEFDQVVPTR